MALSITTLISLFGFSLVFTYVIVNILEFYGVGINVYGSYIGFYLFLLVSIFVLPNDYPKDILRQTTQLPSAPIDTRPSAPEMPIGQQ